MLWRVSGGGVLSTCCWDLGLLQCHSFAVMDAPDYGSPVRTYEHNVYSMWRLHDVFGLRTFDESKPITRMLTGQSANELRLLVPDMDINPQGFHDILIKDLSASPPLWCCHVSLGDITYLSRRWPRKLFRTLKNHWGELNQLRRDSCGHPEWKFRAAAPCVRKISPPSWISI